MKGTRRLAVHVVVAVLATAACGSPGGDAPGPAAGTASADVTLSARDVADEAGIAATVLTHGENCVADLDDDGVSDLVLSIHADAPWQVYRGRGDGTFEEIHTDVFATYDRHGCAVADFDDDGLADLYFSMGACKGRCEQPLHKELWMQRPDGGLVDHAEAWGIGDPFQRGRTPTVLDANGDGRPDLFTGAEIGADHPSPNRLWINVEGRSFQPVDGPPSDEIGNFCSDSGDIDRNGHDDLVVCGAPEHGLRLYTNERGRFTEVTEDVGLPTNWYADAELADLDGDDWPDLVIANKRRVEVWTNEAGSFPERTYTLPLDVGRDLAVGDVDGDGDLDIFVVQRFNAEHPDLLLLNSGDGTEFTPWDGFPQDTTGDGDTAQAIENWKGTGRAAILVNNGRLKTEGPRQLLEFVPSS